MKPESFEKVARVQKHLDNGLSLQAACKKEGTSINTWYGVQKLQSKEAPPAVQTFDAAKTETRPYAKTLDTSKLPKASAALIILRNKAIPAPARIALAIQFLE